MHEFNRILQYKKFHIWWIGFLLGCIFLIANIFLWLSLYVHSFVWEIQNKVWMYFYVSDSVEQDPQAASDIIWLTQELNNAWLQAVFSSKQESLNILTQRIPDILQNFEQFGVDNPIPATLYVMFSNQEQYDSLKTIIVDYRDIITNVSDIQEHATLSEQENRSLRVITIGRFISLVSLFIVLVLGAISFLLGWFFLYTLFMYFHKKIDIKNMLWASNEQVVKPFVYLTLYILWISYASAIILFVIAALFLYILSGVVIHANIFASLNISYIMWFGIVFFQLVVYTVVALVWSSVYITHLNNK